MALNKAFNGVLSATNRAVRWSFSIWGPTNKKRKTYAKQIPTLKKPSFPTLRKFGFLFVQAKLF